MDKVIMDYILCLLTTWLISYCLAAPIKTDVEASSYSAELDKWATFFVRDESYRNCDQTSCPLVDAIFKAMQLLKDPAVTDELARVYEALTKSGKVSDMELPPEKVLFINSLDENIAHQISHLEAYGSTLRPTESNPIRLEISKKMHVHRQKLEQFRLLHEDTTAKQALYEEFEIFQRENPDSQTKIDKVVQFMTDHKLYMDLHNIETSLSTDNDESNGNPSTSYTSFALASEPESFLAGDNKSSQSDDSVERGLRVWSEWSFDSLSALTKSITQILEIIETENPELPKFARLYKEDLSSYMVTLENIMEYHISIFQAFKSFDVSYSSLANAYNPVLIALGKIGNVLERLETAAGSNDSDGSWLSLLIKYTIQNQYLQLKHKYLEIQFLIISKQKLLRGLKHSYTQFLDEVPLSVDAFIHFMQKYQKNADLIKQYEDQLKLRTLGETTCQKILQNLHAYFLTPGDFNYIENLTRSNKMYFEIMELGDEMPYAWIYDDEYVLDSRHSLAHSGRYKAIHGNDGTIKSIHFAADALPDVKKFLMAHKRFLKAVKDAKYDETMTESSVEEEIESIFSTCMCFDYLPYRLKFVHHDVSFQDGDCSHIDSIGGGSSQTRHHCCIIL